MKYLISSKSNNPDIKGGKEVRSKYKNIEDAKYIEIKDERDKENNIDECWLKNLYANIIHFLLKKFLALN